MQCFTIILFKGNHEGERLLQKQSKKIVTFKMEAEGYVIAAGASQKHHAKIHSINRLNALKTYSQVYFSI